MERLFDAAVLAAFLLWGLLVAGSGTAYLGAGVLLAAAAAVGFLLTALAAANPGLPAKAASLPMLPPRLRREVAGLGGSFVGGFSVLTRASWFSGAAVTSVVAWALELGMYVLIAEAFDLGASVTAIAFAGAAANVSLSLPLAQGGVGLFEVAATEALREFGVADNAAAAYSLALHFFLIVPVSLVGLAVLWRTTVSGRRKPAAPAVEAPET
jgi:hypothetical protein